MGKRHYTEEQRQKHNAYVAEAKRRRHAQGAEIGEIPAVVDPKRRASAEKSLSEWAAVYCAHRHRNPDSKNHATMYTALDRAIASPETWLALQAPRGEAKSFKSSEALLYAVMTGRKKFVCCFTSSMSTTETLAQYLEGQFLLESGPFYEDYPEVFAALDTQGSYAQRKVTYKGQDVDMAWGALLNGKKVYKFPKIECCPYSGAIIVLQSITSKIRGMGIVDSNGVPMRPDLILIDDVQDYEVSQNPNRVAKYIDKTDKDILGLSGDSPLSMIVLGTPFHNDCYMSRIMRDKRFDGITLQSVYSFPKHMELWEDYRKLWETTYDETLLQLGPLEKRKSAEAASSALPFFVGRSEVRSLSSQSGGFPGALHRLVVIDGCGLHVLVASDVGSRLHAEQLAVLGNAGVPELVERPERDFLARLPGLCDADPEPVTEPLRRVLVLVSGQDLLANSPLAHRIPR